MKSILLLFQLFIIIELSSIIVAEQTAVVYSAPRSNAPYGFGLLQNGTLKSFTNSPLKGTIDGTCLLSLIGNDLLLVYGQMQFWGQYQVGGLLQYNITSQMWSILGGGNDDARGPPLIDQEIDAVIGITNNDIVVVGDISALPDNIDLNINNIATCNTITGKCKSMGNGIANYYDATGIAAYQDKVYLSYVTTGSISSLIVTLWNNKSWSIILNTTSHFPAPENPFAMAYFDGILYVAGMKSITNNTCYNETVKHIGSWNGTCWTSLNTTAYKILQISEITISDNGTLYAINDYQTAITRYSNKKWTYLLLSKNSPCSSFISPIYVNKDIVYVQCEINHSGGEMAVLALNATSGNWSVLNQTLCSSLLSFVIYNETLWFECTNHDTLPIVQYEPINKEYSMISQVEDLYTNFPEVEAMCTFGKNVFVKGTFAYAGNVLCEQNFAIWNSSSWTTLEINGYDPANNITCGNVSQSLAVAFTMRNFTLGYWIRVVLVEHNLTTTYYDSPILQNTSIQAFVLNKLCVVESNLFFLITGLQYTRVAIFNLNSLSWHLTDFTLLNQDSSINDIVGIGDIIYIGGIFTIESDNGSFTNVAKINMSSSEWLPIEPLLPGPILDLELGSLPGLNTTLYAVGTIDNEFNGVAGCNEEGVWIDRVLGGLLDKQFQQAQFLQATKTFYFLCDSSYFNSIYQYDGIALWPILNSGVVDIEIVDVPPSPGPNIVSTSSSAPDHLIWIIIFSILALIMLIISIIVYRITKRKRGYKYIQIPMYNTFDVETNISKLLDDKHIPKIDADNVQFLEIIGGGGQGIVQKALWKGQHVAIKSLPFIDPKLLANFLQEIKLLSQLHHENIVEFLGVMVKQTENKIWLVTELMDTDLGKVANLLTYEEKLQVAKDVSKAMVYLHGQKPPVLHRDLKLNNILISKDGRCKITDFGISRTKPAASAPITRNVGTLTFTAPEVLVDGRYNEKCDVYSMGIVFAELFGGKNPFAHVEYEWSLEFIKKFTGKEISPILPDNVPPKMYDLIKSCMEWEPEDRPSFVEIVDNLKKMSPHFFYSLK